VVGANEKSLGADARHEAPTVFLDERAVLISDPDHSEDEDRFILLGLSSALRMLVVCHCHVGTMSSESFRRGIPSVTLLEYEVEFRLRDVGSTTAEVDAYSGAHLC